MSDYSSNGTGPANGSAQSCVVLVPAYRYIEAACEEALRELERRGYTVWRRFGGSAIDWVRNELAAKALREGFTETFWIDSDVVFDPDDVDKLRARDLPMAAGLYPKKCKRGIAAVFSKETKKVMFGEAGGMLPLLGAGAGFLYVKKEVYDGISAACSLPLCYEGSGHDFYPFFMPMVEETDAGNRYWSEDCAFCVRAAKAGYQLYADTTIRLYHIGSYQFGWEDAGRPTERYRSFNLQVVRDDPSEAQDDSRGSGLFSRLKQLGLNR